MTPKEYLEQIYKADRKAQRVTARLNEARAMMYSVKSPSDMNADRVQTSMSGDKMEQIYSRCYELEKELLKELDTLRRIRDRVSAEIEQIEGHNAVHTEQIRTLLQKRYEAFERWEMIAVEMNVSLRYVYILHGQALQLFERQVMRKK